MDFGDFVIVGACLFVGLVMGAMSTSDMYEEQAIERGYALYCPADGNFAWKGECKGIVKPEEMK